MTLKAAVKAIHDDNVSDQAALNTAACQAFGISFDHFLRMNPDNMPAIRAHLRKLHPLDA